MKKVMILGAGNAQIDAVKYCKSKKYKVYGCSYSDKDKGVSLFDEFIKLDIKDIDGITSYANENKIDFVYSIGSDLAMPSVMKVSENLNLPHFVSYETARICQNKDELRKTLGNHFAGNIDSISADHIEEACKFDVFPAMLKPADSQGQRGCYKVNDSGDIKKYFEISLSHSPGGRVILEEYISGPEISVNAYVCEGEVKFALISDRIVFEDLPGGIIKEHHLPSKFTNENSAEKTFDLVRRVCEKTGIKNGPVYFQIKLKMDNPCLIEVTPRLDGCHMWNLIYHYCGVNLLEASFEHLINNVYPNFNYISEEKERKLIFMCEKTGNVFKRGKYDTTANIYCCWYYEDGEMVKKLNGFMEKCGYIIQ